jgi:glycogen synthase
MNEKEDKNVCPDCGEVHENDSIDNLANAIASAFTEESFPDMWNKLKKELKPLTKKEIEDKSFILGAVSRLETYMKGMDDILEHPPSKKNDLL